MLRRRKKGGYGLGYVLRLLLCGMFVISFSGRCFATEHLLADNGETDYVIVKPVNASYGFNHYVAMDFSRILKEATGADFKVIEEGKISTKSKKIYIGPTKFAAQNGIDIEKLRRDEWVFRSIGDDIVIAGDMDIGGRYAVFEFLEKYLGCLWLDPTTEIIPKRSIVRIPMLDVRQKPAFKAINISTLQYAIFVGDKKKQWRNSLFIRHNKHNGGSGGGSPRGCHTFYYYSKNWSFEPSEHPEYYSMDSNGKRQLPDYSVAKHGGMYGHLCLSNPEVPKLLLNELRKFIEKDRERVRRKERRFNPKIYDISQNDPGGRICNCPECMKIVEREGGTDAGLLLHALNPVAEEIAKEYPDIKIQTFAYKFGIRPPKHIRPADNLRIRFADLGREWGGGKFDARDQLFPITHPINKRSYENLTGWGKIAKSIAIWGYWGIYREKFDSPYVVTQCMKPDLELYKQNNVKSIFVQLDSKVDVMSFFALTRWLGYKLMQNPDQPIKPLIRKFMKGYYDPAATVMEKYLHYLEQRILDTNSPLNELSVEKRPYLDLEFFTTVQDLLDKAEAACSADSPELFHVKRERVPVDCALLHLWVKLEKRLPEGKKLPFNRKKVLNRYKTNWVKQAQVMFSEKYYKEYRKERISQEIRSLDVAEQVRIDKLKSAPMPHIDVTRTQENPNGNPGKVDWSKVSSSKLLYTLKGLKIDNQPNVKVAHDGKYLYVRLTDSCAEKLVTGSKPWVGDDWELFFARQKRKRPYYQLLIDPKGERVQYIYFIENGKKKSAEWESKIVVVSKKVKNTWTVSIAVPLKSIPVKKGKKDKMLFANFFRVRTSPKEMIGWSPTFKKSMHVQSRMGKLTLKDIGN